MYLKHFSALTLLFGRQQEHEGQEDHAPSISKGFSSEDPA